MITTTMAMTPQTNDDNDNDNDNDNNNFNNPVLPSSVYSTIQHGKAAVLPNFFSESEILKLRAEAHDLFNDDKACKKSFSTALVNAEVWKSEQSGNLHYRMQIESMMGKIRRALALNLDRPNLEQKIAKEHSEYTIIRYDPGAYLTRHVDECHEERKGAIGWSNPTRRSISWFIYINESDWDIHKHGGALRCFERKNPFQGQIGVAKNGDLQVGWLGQSAIDRFERPVYMDANYDADCRMYTVDGDGTTKTYISRTFRAHPILYSGSETPDLVSKILFTDERLLAERFRLIEPLAPMPPPDLIFPDEEILDVEPKGGTLVLFDSVAVPHEVLPVKDRLRFGYHGFFHEEQEEEIV